MTGSSSTIGSNLQTTTATNGSGIDWSPDHVGPIGKYLHSLGIPRAAMVGAFITFCLVFIGLLVALRLVVPPLTDYLFRKRDVDENAQKPLLRVIHIVGFFVALLTGFKMGGYGDLLQLLTAFGAAATLAIGFALKDLLSNFVAGMFIYLDRPFRIGHWIKWPGSGDLPNEGIVVDISLRVTRIHTFNNELLTVPNSKLTENVIMNPTANNKLRIDYTFGIGYNDDIEEASEIIKEEAQRHPKILEHPTPTVQLHDDALADSAVGLTTLFWIENPNRRKYATVRSEFVQNVKARFDKVGIEIPFPQVDLSGEITTVSEAPPRNYQTMD